MNKAISFCLVLILSLLMLSGCMDQREVDDLTYVVAMGLDKGETNTLRLTLQYVIPLAVGGTSGGGGGGQTSGSMSTVTLECPSLLTGINLANNFIGKQLNISHAKVAVFSQELAESGEMIGYINGMVKSREFRPSLVIAVSIGSAKSYLESIKPKQEADPSKYYELKFSSYKYTGFTVDSSFYQFYSALISSSQQPVATLVGVSDNKTEKDFLLDKSTAKGKGHPTTYAGDYLAGQIPKLGDVQGETMGMAAFIGDRMVYAFDGREATYYLMATGKYNYSTFTIPDPKEDHLNVIVNISQRKKPNIHVDLRSAKPKIMLKFNFEGDYLAIQSGLNYEDDPLRTLFERTVEAHIRKEMLQFLNKTSSQFGSDICGFGQSAKMQFFTQSQWEQSHWLKRYKNALFSVDVDFKIRRSGLTLRTSPIKGGE